MRIFTLKSCDICRKSLRDLRMEGHDPQITDVRADGISPADLKNFLTKFGDDLTNRRSTTWRGLSAQDRNKPALELLALHPTLMKRPLIDADGQLFLGWGPEVRSELLG